MSGDAVSIAPDVYSVVLENERSECWKSGVEPRSSGETSSRCAVNLGIEVDSCSLRLWAHSSNIAL